MSQTVLQSAGLKVGCTTGSGELGAMGPSKHDSIDNTDSFYGQPVKNRSDDS